MGLSVGGLGLVDVNFASDALHDQVKRDHYAELFFLWTGTPSMSRAKSESAARSDSTSETDKTGKVGLRENRQHTGSFADDGQGSAILS